MKLRKIHASKAKHDVNSPTGVALRDLAAYRLLEHFKGDWKVAQKHALAHGDGYPYWRGEKEWRSAHKRCEHLLEMTGEELQKTGFGFPT